MMAKERNMKISVSNYGPIAEAKDIELCPLTVFVGPSNTGKSYLAVLIYALFNSLESDNRLSRFRYSRASRRRTKAQTRERQDEGAESAGKNIVGLLKQLFEAKEENSRFSNLPEELKEWVNEKIAEEINDKFHHEVSRCMGTSLKEDHLTRNEFKFNFEDDRKKISLGSSETSPSMKIKKLDLDQKEFSRLRRHMAVNKDFPDRLKREVFFDVLLENFLYSATRMAESFYLPAARMGIMQSHRVIAGALVQRATSAGLEALSVPTLSGVLSDFIQEIIFMDTSEIPDSNVGSVADIMEEKILYGSIKMEGSETNQYPQLLYKRNGLEIPLLRSSSMVSELAPIVLFIRHRVGKGDLLIIEEPESHLHPAAQKSIAKVIVHLVRAGVRVMVTTHSDYFLEQLSNHVRATKLKESKGTKLTGFGFLKEEEIGAYVFNQHKTGTVVKKLHFDNETGLSPEDHDKVSTDLYDETIEFLDKLDQQG